MLHKRVQTYVNVRVDDVGSADGTSNLLGKCVDQSLRIRAPALPESLWCENTASSWWLSRTHRVGGAVSVCSSVTEENTHFVH